MTLAKSLNLSVAQFFSFIKWGNSIDLTVLSTQLNKGSQVYYILIGPVFLVNGPCDERDWVFWKKQWGQAASLGWTWDGGWYRRAKNISVDQWNQWKWEDLESCLEGKSDYLRSWGHCILWQKVSDREMSPKGVGYPEYTYGVFHMLNLLSVLEYIKHCRASLVAQG